MLVYVTATVPNRNVPEPENCVVSATVVENDDVDVVTSAVRIVCASVPAYR